MRGDANAVRLFISLAVPEKIRKTIKSRASAIRSLRGVKWEPEKKFHITLRFLGGTSAERIPGIRSALGGCCGRFFPPVIKTEGVSAITRRRYPETLAVMADGDDALYDLKEGIDSELEALGFEPERRDFLPHITIGRVKKKMKLPELPQFELEFTAERVCLMQSELRGEGARHTEIGGFEL